MPWRRSSSPSSRRWCWSPRGLRCGAAEDAIRWYKNFSPRAGRTVVKPAGAPYLCDGSMQERPGMTTSPAPLPGDAFLDLMSSWVSHLPPEVAYARVAGVGMNAEELAENPFLDEWYVQNLNREPRLPLGDGEFDGAAICVSIQYLVRPVEVLREVARVLRPLAPLVITFSNRCFPTKAIACWRLFD